MTNQNKTSRPTGTVGSCFFDSADRRPKRRAALPRRGGERSDPRQSFSFYKMFMQS